MGVVDGVAILPGTVQTVALGGDITTAGKAILDDADAAAQRTTLGLGTLATQNGTFSGTSSGTNTGDVTLAGTPDYLTIAGQTITRGLVDLTTDVTGDLPLANLAQASGASQLLGRGAGAGAGDFQEITLGSNLSMTGTTLNAAGTTIPDGDKGDITVSGTGSVWTIDAGVVDTAKLGGDITTAGKALLDDADASAQRTTLGLGTLATQSGTFSGTSSGTNTGDVTLTGTPDYITISGQVITRGLVDLATDVTGDLPFSNLTGASGASVLLGRGSAAGAGDFQEITLGTNLSMSGTTLNATGGSGSGDVVGDDTSTTVQNIVAYNTTGGKNITELTGTQGDVLYHNGTSWVKLAAGTSGNFLKTNGAGANPAWAAAPSLSDGDKGDITVSGSGATWTIDNDVVTYAKIQNVSTTDRLLGRSTAGAGDIEEITCTAAGRALLDDADATTQRSTLGLGTLATQSGTFSGTSSGTNTGDVTLSGTPDYITIAGQVITRGLIDLATDITGDLPFSNLTQVASDTILGRSAAGTGDVTTLTCTAAGRNLLDDPDTTTQRATLGLGTLATKSSVDLTTDVTGDLPFSNITQIATDTLLGRSTAGTGDIETIACSAAGRALIDDVDAATQRTTLGLGTLATQSGTFSGTSSGTNTGDVTLNGSPDYITISGQTITRNAVDLATDITGVLPYANGGTNNSTVPTANSGDYVLVYDSSTGVAKVINVSGAGTTQFLRYNNGDVLFDTPPTFTSGAAGYAPASGGGTTNFLRADGTWTTPTVGSVSAANVTAGTFPGATYTFSDSLTVTSDLTVDTNLIKTDSTNNRVGINQTTPLYALDVTGTQRVTGTTTFNGLTYTWPSTQSANQVLQTNGSGTLSWATASGSDPWTYKTLASDYTTTSATLATISIGGVSFDFTPAANTNYEFEALLMLRTSTATNNPRTAVAWPTGMTDGVTRIQQTGSTATTLVYTSGSIAATVQVAAGGLPDNTNGWPCFIKGVMRAGATPSSTLRIQMAAETAGGTMTVETGSFLKYRTI